jgi:predicted amidohydrolase YtcJ
VQGRLTGRLVEQAAFEPLKQGLIEATPKAEMLGRFASTMRAYAANGNTTVVSAGLSSDQGILFRLQQYLAEEHPDPYGKALTAIRMFPERTALPRHFLYIRPEMAEQFLPASPDNGDDFFRVVGVKLWYDGSPYTGSMYLATPYLVSPLSEEELHIHAGDTGEPLISQEQLVAAIEEYNGQGWQVIVHAQGDQALADTVAAFETAATTMDIAPYRDRIEHGLLLSDSMLRRMWALGVSPSYHINHIYYYGEALRDSILGPERAEAALPVRTSVDIGQPFSLHADQPMFDSDPLSLIATAVSRSTQHGAVLGADQAITVEQGLRAVTTMAAWQIGMADQLGSITPGKFADLVVLDRNPMQTPVGQLRDISVLRTIVAGNEVPRDG